MKSSAAKRTRPAPLDAVVVLLVVLSAVALMLAFWPKGGDHFTATVVLEGETITHFDLTGSESPHTYSVPNARYPITLELSQNSIRVSHSDCPSQDCVRIGWVSRSGGQIVCLPNKMVVSVRSEYAPDVDAVVG